MRNALFAALVGSTAILGIGPAMAQTQPQVTQEDVPAGEVRARAAISECDRLITLLEQGPTPNAGVTTEQARDWRFTANAQACHENLQRLSEANKGGANVTAGQQPPLSGSPGSDPTAPQAAPAGGLGTEPQGTGALPSAGIQSVRTSQLKTMGIFNARDEKLGEVEGVMKGPNDKVYVVVAHGGFLGLGERRVAMPVDQVAIRGDRLVVQGLSDEQIKAMPAFDKSVSGYQELPEDQATQLHMLQ